MRDGDRTATAMKTGQDAEDAVTARPVRMREETGGHITPGGEGHLTQRMKEKRGETGGHITPGGGGHLTRKEKRGGTGGHVTLRGGGHVTQKEGGHTTPVVRRGGGRGGRRTRRRETDFMTGGKAAKGGIKSRVKYFPSGRYWNYIK